MTTDEIQCRFFEARYDWPRCARISLEEEFDYGYSELTPGMGYSLDVAGYDEQNSLVGYCYEQNATLVIHALCQFAADLIAND
jgi:hypothetical protein